MKALSARIRVNQPAGMNIDSAMVKVGITWEFDCILGFGCRLSKAYFPIGYKSKGKVVWEMNVTVWWYIQSSVR